MDAFFARPGVWANLTTPGSKSYHPLWAPVMIYETAGNALRLLWLVVLTFLFFRQKRLFKPLMIAFQVTSVAYLWLDHYLTIQVMPTVSGHTAQLIGQTVGTLLWSLYLLVSQRVKNTFVR